MNSSENAGERESKRRSRQTAASEGELLDPAEASKDMGLPDDGVERNGAEPGPAMSAPALAQDVEDAAADVGTTFEPGAEDTPAASIMGEDQTPVEALAPIETVEVTPTTDTAEAPAAMEGALEAEADGQESVDPAPTPDIEGSETTQMAPVGVVTGELDEADAVEGEAAEDQSEELMPLPINAVVGGKYLVQSQLHASPDRNLYRVVARQQQRCPNCGRLSSADAEACEACGTAVDGQQPPAEFYLMAESFRPEALVQDPGLMARNLYHPNLVPVVDFFSYKPYGRTRYFAVAEPRGGVRLSQLSLPRPATQVITWAMQLADALEYLHSQGVVGAGAESDDILVQGDRASLASLQNAQSSSDDEASTKEQQKMDLARLAGTIYEAYTGTPATLTPEGVLPVPPGAPEKMSSAFRAAIEPIQGTSPAVSVRQWRDMLAAALSAISELERPARPVSFVSAHLTSVGRLREQNQDSYAVSEFIQASEERPYYLGLYVVADGLGGHKGGEIASAIATQTFGSEILGRVMSPLVGAGAGGEKNAPSNEAILQAMTRGIQAANDRIYKARNNRQNDMGTTMVAALVSAGKAYIANVGDSRLYLLTQEEQEVEETGTLDATRPLPMGTMPLDADLYLQRRAELADGTVPDTIPIDRTQGFHLEQISVDHSLVHRLVELGQLDPEEAKVHPHRNFIYRSLGGPPPIEVDTFVRTLKPGDRLLLCSDGLNSMVGDEDIEAALRAEQNPADACRKLVALANDAGGHDNITTIIIDVLDYLPYSEPL